MRTDRHPTAADLLAFGLTERLKLHFRMEPRGGSYAVIVRVGRTAEDMKRWEMVFPNRVPLASAIDELGGRVLRILQEGSDDRGQAGASLSNDDQTSPDGFPRFKQLASI